MHKMGFGLFTRPSNFRAPARLAIAPIYMMPGTPRFRLPPFSVKISPNAPNRITVPKVMEKESVVDN